ncbi:MAG: hypothetical protein UX28_C0001G0094 [Candidatus Pacebacteria bacterium GW2011_GWA1_46_10]|nr:MAG: hypothetical protein UX28_C0001G0094 [Candidatus Pacebacteria bacterium GW2011_GWA1_46_10]HCR81731.1 hypothetical protein [Candidatus Paceibacterota bacterium]
MPKRVFWPTALVVMGLIFMASNLGYLPTRFWNLWPVILVVVGLGGLLTSDREDWVNTPKKTSRRRPIRKARAKRRK